MPMNVETLPDADHLRQKFEYIPETGIVLWRRRPETDFASVNAFNTWNSRFMFKEAGWRFTGNDGKLYICLTLDYRKMLAHRVIWKMVTGNDPLYQIDHQDGDGTNNRWSNLREANSSEQLYNKRVRRDNRVGLKGVNQLPNGRYRAIINYKGHQHHLGTFDTAEEAHQMYCAEAQRLHGKFFNPG